MSGLTEVHRQRTKLDAKFKRISEANLDTELLADYSKYLCVLVSGFLETSIYEILISYAKNKSSPAVLKYVDSQLSWWTNPSADKINSLVGFFDLEWRAKIEAYLVDEKKEAVNSLIALRHKIAHGESVGTSFSQVKRYYDEIRKLVDKIAEIVGP